MKEKTLNLIFGLVAVVLLVSAVFGFSMYSNAQKIAEDRQKELETANQAKAVLTSEVAELETEVSEIAENLTQKSTQVTQLEGQVVEQAGQLEDLQGQVDELEAQAEEETEESNRYVEDELVLGDEFKFDSLSDREIDTLYDSEIEFADEDVNVEEFYFMEGVIAINENDFEDNAYMTLQEDGIMYSVVFEDTLETEEISANEELEFNFLGNEMRVSEWNGDELKVSYGEAQFLSEGDVVDFDGHSIVIGHIYEDSVIITVDDETEIVPEDETEEFEGLEIFVENVLYDEDENSMIKVQIANEITSVIESGDEFEEDSIWNWYINEADRTIGLTLNTDFDEIDDDEDYQAIMPGGYISLPYEYVVVFYDGITSEDYSDYDFELDDSYLEINGNFEAGMESYDVIYADAFGLYEKDGNDYNLLSDVTLSDSEIEIEVVGDAVKFDDVVVKLDLSDVIVDGTSLVDEEDNYRNSYGMIFVSPEDSLEDEELTISVPEEAIEASISFE